MIKKRFKKIALIIFVLVILVNIFMDIDYYYFKQETIIKNEKDVATKRITVYNEILQAREDFLKEKAEKGNKLKYESRWEKPFKKQFDSKLHCEIPDDIKVMYDKILLIESISETGDDFCFNWWSSMHSITGCARETLKYTYDREFSKRMPQQVGFKQPINLWSKEQNENCKKLEELNRKYLIEQITKKIKDYEEYYKNLEEYEKWKINIFNPFLKIPQPPYVSHHYVSHHYVKYNNTPLVELLEDDFDNIRSKIITEFGKQ